MLTRAIPRTAPTTERKPAKGPKLRHCSECRQPFLKTQAVVSWCSFDCGAARGIRLAAAKKAKQAREERAQTRAQLKELESVRAKKKRLQPIVNHIARVRDHADGCISCNKPATWSGQWHGSHYKSSGSNSALTFNLWNIHKACSECNRNKGGNIHEYRPRLIAKAGADRVNWLDHHPRSREYTGEELDRAIVIATKWLKRKLKQLKETAT